VKILSGWQAASKIYRKSKGQELPRQFWVKKTVGRP
jgi:hypothetical protein